MKKSTKNLRILIDADPIRYRVGFAAEDNWYKVVVEHCDKMDVLRFVRNDKHTALQLLKAWKEAHPDHEIVDEEKHTDVAPLPHVLMMLRFQVESIIREVVQEYGKDKRDIFTNIILSGGENYRDKLGTFKKYHGNRAEDRRPQHYKEIGDHLVRNYGAYVVKGREADDEVSLIARRSTDDYVIATIDKDLDQIPGKHYDYMKKVHYDVSEADALLWFWSQVLSGDSADNIGGVCGCGPVCAAKMIEEFGDLSEESRWDLVVDLYAQRAEKPGCYYAGQNPEAVAIENARLVYLQREPGELWTPPGCPQKYLLNDGVNIDD